MTENTRSRYNFWSHNAAERRMESVLYQNESTETY